MAPSAPSLVPASIPPLAPMLKRQRGKAQQTELSNLPFDHKIGLWNTSHSNAKLLWETEKQPG